MGFTKWCGECNHLMGPHRPLIREEYPAELIQSSSFSLVIGGGEEMIRTGFAILVGAIFVAGAAAQAQTSAQTSTQASGQASVEANKQGAQASGGASSTSGTSAQAGSNSASLANGTALNAELNSSLDSKKAKTGDQVVARTTEAVKSDGKTIIPKGTKLVGHVTQASAKAKGDSESALAIQFDKAILKNGQEMPLNVAIRALAAGQSNASAGSPGPDLDAMGNAGAAAAGGSPMSGGTRGAVGGVTSTAGAAAGSVANTAATVDRTAGGAVNAAGSAAGSASSTVGGLNGAGQLTSNSRGVFGLNGLNLVTDASSATQGSVITSAGKNVHLEGGTKMLLISQTAATPSATPNK
jgi:hypothetical protein